MWTKTRAWLGIASATLRVGSTTRPDHMRVTSSSRGSHTGTCFANPSSISAVSSRTLSAPRPQSIQNGTSHPWTLARTACGSCSSVQNIVNLGKQEFTIKIKMFDPQQFRATLPIFGHHQLSQFLSEVKKAREMPPSFGNFVHSVQNMNEEEANRVITDLESELYQRYKEVDSWLNLD